MGDKDIVSKEIIKEIGRDISMHVLGIDIQGEVTLVDKGIIDMKDIACEELLSDLTISEKNSLHSRNRAFKK